MEFLKQLLGKVFWLDVVDGKMFLHIETDALGEIEKIEIDELRINLVMSMIPTPIMAMLKKML